MTDRPVADREPLSDKLENDLRELWAATPAELAKRLIRRGWSAHPDEAGLREAVKAYVDWQYREKGASRFTLTALRAALAHPDVPVAGAEDVATAIGLTWTPAEAEAVARAYAAGHRDGLGCGIESAGFGFVECEHVGRPRAVPAAGAEPELQALAHEIAKEWTPHDHDPVKCPECAALRAAQPEDDGLDVRRVKQAVANVAARHGVKADPPMTVEQMAVARIFGYSTAPVTMDAEIATEYARLRVERRDGA